MMTVLPDGDYVLAEGAAWLDVPLGEQTATLRVRRNAGRDARHPPGPGLIVEVYRHGEEDQTAVAALFVAREDLEGDLEPEDDPETLSVRGPNDERA